MSNKALYATLYTACAQRANQHLGCSTNIRLGKPPCRRREGVVRNSVAKILPLGKSRNVKKLTDYDFEDPVLSGCTSSVIMTSIMTLCCPYDGVSPIPRRTYSSLDWQLISPISTNHELRVSRNS